MTFYIHHVYVELRLVPQLTTYSRICSKHAPDALRLSSKIRKLVFPPSIESKDVVESLLKRLVIAPDISYWRCNRTSDVMVLLPQKIDLGRSVVTLKFEILFWWHISAL
jgi:hypothetical protein